MKSNLKDIGVTAFACIVFLAMIYVSIVQGHRLTYKMFYEDMVKETIAKTNEIPEAEGREDLW